MTVTVVSVTIFPTVLVPYKAQFTADPVQPVTETVPAEMALQSCPHMPKDISSPL